MSLLAGHYGFTAEPACALSASMPRAGKHADRELDFMLNYDTRLRFATARQVKYRLGRDTETEEE